MPELKEMLGAHAAPSRHATIRSNGSTPGEGPVKMKRLTLDIPEALHREIKKNAAHEGITMVEKLRALLMQHYGLTDMLKDSQRD